MGHPTVASDKEPIRLFQSDFLEFFTHINPLVVCVIWLPIISFFLARSFGWQTRAMKPISVFSGILLGLIIWTVSEYLLHRFLFHMPARNKTMERITFLFHGVHHAQPQCKTRLVMPPIVSLPLAALFYGLFFLFGRITSNGAGWVSPLFSGFSIGYLVYDMLHYATHHFAMRNGYWKFIKRYHMQHHYKTPNQQFGVSSPLWDWVFGTMPE
jgi:sterol desaturase/sphingolipid hydroxylase (fatty acid hydroxylase superfamily)